MASTLRLRILRVCLNEAHTNKEIAGALDKDPATTLHHVRRLVDTGFLEPLAPRRGVRGSREIPYLATGKSWRIHAPGQSLLMLNAFLEEVALVPDESVNSARTGLRLNEIDRDEFEERITMLLNEYHERHDPDGRPWSVFFAIHPDPNRE